MNIGPGVTQVGHGESTNYHNGNIGLVRWYNTALSSTQISQNFAATRSRFGI
jgi:hypothetical protein